MKTIYLILSLFLLLTLFIACEDSLGYDPNVQITKQQEDIEIPDDTPTPTKFKVTNYSMVFYEVFMGAGNRSVRFIWDYNIKSAEIMLDSSSSNPHIWISLDIENLNTPDKFYTDRGISDRILEFDLYFAGELLNQVYRLDDREKGSRWLKIKAKDISHRKIYDITGAQVPCYLFYVDDDKRNGVLKLSIAVEIKEFFHSRGRRFVGDILLFYRE